MRMRVVMVKANRLWRWYFVVVIVLTVVATVILWVFNASIQLSAEELARQQALWKEHGPRDYYLAYFRVPDDAQWGKFYRVHVRGGVVVKAEEFDVQVRDRADITPQGEPQAVAAEQLAAHNMDALFALAQSDLAADREQERRAYARGRFHPENGAILEYVHRLMGSRTRVQVSVLAFKYGDDLPSVD